MQGPSRYRVASLLKSGGNADVFVGTAEGEGGFRRRVAIKVIRDEMARDPAAIRAFMDEARIASQLHHANIVSVLDFGLMDGLPFQVLDLVQGLDLRQALAHPTVGGVLPPVIALHIGVEVAHALSYAHSALGFEGEPLSIVHRDISPENILLSWSGDVKLSDFGIARALGRLEVTRAGETKGKLAYMAPEQALADDVDRRADIFALGCVLHEMLTGSSPLAAEPSRERVLLGNDCEIDAGLELDLRSIIAKATRNERIRRQQNAHEIAGELGTALARRISTDARTMMTQWISTLAAPHVAPRARGAGDLFEVELVLGLAPDSAPRRFESVAAPTSGRTLVERLRDPDRDRDRDRTLESIARKVGSTPRAGTERTASKREESATTPDRSPKTALDVTVPEAEHVRDEAPMFARTITASVSLPPAPQRRLASQDSRTHPSFEARLERSTRATIPRALLMLLTGALALGAAFIARSTQESISGAPMSTTSPAIAPRPAASRSPKAPSLGAAEPAPSPETETTGRASGGTGAPAALEDGPERALSTSTRNSPSIALKPISVVPATDTRSLEMLRRRVEIALERRGLSHEDVRHASSMRPALDRFETALEEKRSADAETLADEIVESIGRISVDDHMLESKIGRLASRMRKLGASSLDRSTLDQLEERFLDLRSAAGSASSAEERNGVALKAASLEDVLGVLERRAEQAP